MSEEFAKEAPGAERIRIFREGGVPEEKINSWKQERLEVFTSGGVPKEKIEEYFGEREPDLTNFKNQVQENLKTYKVPEALSPLAPKPNIADKAVAAIEQPFVPHEGPYNADGILGALEAGFQMSTHGLIQRGKLPDLSMPKDAEMFQRIAYSMGMMAGDTPEMIAGGFVGAKVGGTTGAIAGGLAGSVVPGVGTMAGVAGGGAAGAVIGAGAGAFAAPAMMRTALIEQYQKGDIKTFNEFWERSSVVLLEGVKAGAIGGATSVVGGAVGAGLTKTGSGAFVKSSTVAASEIATMVGVGSAIEGHVPNMDEFLDAAVMIGGLHGTARITSRLMKVYEKTGIRPAQLIEQIEQNPALKTEMLAEGTHVPKSLEKLADIPLGEPGKSLKVGDETLVLEQRPTPGKNKISEKIVPHPESKKESYSFDRFMEDAIDYLHPLKKLDEAFQGKKFSKIEFEESAYGAARLSAGKEARTQAWFDNGPINAKTGEQTGTRGLRRIFDEMGQEKRIEWKEYAISLRAVEKEGQGIKTGLDLAEAKKLVDSASPEVKKYHAEILKNRDETLQYMVDRGIVSQKTADIIRSKNQDFVPMYRLQEESIASGREAGTARKTGSPIKEMKGSEKDILDPIDSLIKDQVAFLKIVERNEVLTKIGDMAVKDAEKAKALGIEAVAPEQAKITVKDKELQKWLDSHGIEAEASEFAIFRKKDFRLAENEISFMRNGERQVYTVPEGVKRALENMDAETANVFLKLAGGFTSSLKTGVSLSLEFIARNPVRDQLSAFVLSKNGFLPVVSALDGLGSIVKKDKHYKEWLYERGANAVMTSFDSKAFTKDYAKLDKQTAFLSNTWNVVKSPVELLKLTSQIAEESTRVGEYKAARRKGKSVELAAFESRDLLDFAKVGAKGKAVNQIVAYFNAPIQARVKLVERLVENPVEVSAKIAASTVLPTVLLWWAQKDDERYQEIPNWQKDNFFVITTDKWEDIDPRNPPPVGSMTRQIEGKMQVNNGIIYRVPMNQDTAMVSALTRRTLEAYFKENPDAYKDFSESMTQAFQVNYMPQPVLPVIEQMANYSFFTERPLVSHGMEKVLPELRYNEYTSETAKQLGKAIASVPGMRESGIAAPVIIENYIRQWTGTTGMHVLRVADSALVKAGTVVDPVKAEKQWHEIAPINAFTIRYPSTSAQSIEDFRTKYQSMQTYMNSLSQLEKRGDFENYERINSIAMAQGKLLPLKGIDEALAESRKAIVMINNIKDITPAEKRQLIDGIYYQMIEASRLGNKIINDTQKALKQKQD